MIWLDPYLSSSPLLRSVDGWLKVDGLREAIKVDGLRMMVGGKLWIITRRSRLGYVHTSIDTFMQSSIPDGSAYVLVRDEETQEHCLGMT